MITRFNWIAVFLFFLTANLIFAGGSSETGTNTFNRVIELRDPIMQGEDIEALQKHLLSLKFSGITEADGIYNPLTADGYYDRSTGLVILLIQNFSGFEMDGRVERPLWDFIFDRSNASFLENISILCSIDPTSLEKSVNLFDIRSESEVGDYNREAFVYYSRDNTPKMMEYYHGTEYTSQSLICYFLNINDYFVEYLYVTPNPSDREEKLYYFSNNTLYEVKNGIRVRSNDRYNIEAVNEVIDRFRSAYR